MAGLMDLFITIGVEDNASGSIENISKKIGSGLKNAAKIGVAAVAAVSGAVIALGGAFVSGAASVAAYGDQIDKMSQKMGLSSKSYQEWDFILQHSGASIDSMQRGMMTLTLAAENGSDAFSALGMSQEQVASMSQDELFAATIEGLQGIEDSGERAALAQKLLGASAKELGPLLNMSAEETEAMRQQVHALGGVMSEDAVKASAQFQDSLQNMKTAFNGVKMSIMTQFLPSLSTVMDGISKVFSGDKSGVQMIIDGVHNLASQIQTVVPELISAAEEIIGPVIDAIGEVLPDLISTLLPVLITGATKLIVALASHLPELLAALWEGLKAAASEIWPVLQEAWGGVKEWFGNLFANAWQAVKDVFAPVGEFFSGIWESIKGVFNGVVGWFTDTFAPVGDAIAAAFEAMEAAAKKAAEFILTVFGPVVNFFKGLANLVGGVFDGRADTWVNQHGGNGTGWEGINAIGNDYVPYDGYRAVLHRGEAVLTAREAEEWRRGEGSNGVENVFNFYGVSQSDMEMIAEYVNGALA